MRACGLVWYCLSNCAKVNGRTSVANLSPIGQQRSLIRGSKPVLCAVAKSWTRHQRAGADIKKLMTMPTDQQPLKP
jgi:hypothetical protein